MPVKTTTPEQPTLPGFGKPPNPKKQIPPEDLAIAQAAEGALEVRTTHGNKASIHQAGNPTPILAIIRHPDGTLEPESSSVQPGRIRLPNPRVPPEQQHDRILFIYHYVKAAAHHQAAIAIEESGYQAGTQRTHEWIDELTKEWATEHRELSPAVHGRTRMWEFIARVSELIDPTAWELAQDTKGHVLIAPYNRAVLNRDILSDLRETNPGASAWAVSRHAGYQPANHPGQIIQSARPFMENIGVERKNWKLVAGLDPNMMSELTRPHVPKYLTAMIINACGDAHINPDLPAIQNAIHIAIRCRHKAASIQPRGKNPTPAQTNRRRKPPKHHQTADQRRSPGRRPRLHPKTPALPRNVRLHRRLHQRATTHQVHDLPRTVPSIREMAPPPESNQDRRTDPAGNRAAGRTRTSGTGEERNTTPRSWETGSPQLGIADPVPGDPAGRPNTHHRRRPNHTAGTNSRREKHGPLRRQLLARLPTRQ